QIAERKETIAPADRVRRLEPLEKGERGRLGERPPRAAVEQARQSDEPAKQRFDAPGRERDSDDAKKRVNRPDEDAEPRQRGEGFRDRDRQERQLRERARPDRGPEPFKGEQVRPDRGPSTQLEDGRGPDR